MSFFTPFAFVKQEIAAAAPFTGILDTYTGAVGAWSVARRLSGTYNGSLFRVRRASDNTEQDIGYNSVGGLDTSALSSFCSGTNGFVQTIYDQSGNGVNLAQPTSVSSSRQPKIYDSVNGLNVENGIASMNFDLGDNLIGNYATSSNSLMSVFSVASPFATNTTYVIYSQYNTPTAAPAFGLADHSTNSLRDFMWGAAQEAVYSPNTTNLAVRAGIRRTSTTPNNAVYLNGTIGGTTTSVTDVTIGTNVAIGTIFHGNTSGAGTFPYRGEISEVIVWRTDQTSNVSGINSNMATFYGI
jgi:hypothetical protein